MADDIKLVIGVEQGGLLKAITNTEALEKKVKKLSAAYAKDSVSYGRYNKAIGDLAKATNKSKKELLDYGRAIRAEEKATKKATAETKAYAKARREAEQVNKALTKATQKQTAAQITSNKVMSQAKNRMNGNNMAIQQLGYQFGDFAVQVQSGTSAFVAFSQQGAQLAGILPMIATPLGLSMGAAVALSAGLGILIPIVGVVGRALFEMGGNAKSASEKADALKESLEDLSGAADLLRDLAEINLSGQFAEAKEELKGLVEELNKLKREQARDAFSTAIKSFVEGLSDQMLSAKKLADEAGKELARRTSQKESVEEDSKAYKELSDRIQKLIPRQVEATKAALEYGDLLKEIGKIQSSSNSKDYAANMVAFANTLRNSEYVTEGLKKQMMELLDETGLIVNEVEKLGEEQKEVNKVAESFLKTQEESAKAQAKIKEAVKEIKDNFNEELIVAKEKLRLSEIELAKGKDSVKYKEEVAKQERRQLESRLRSDKILGSHLKQIMDIYDEEAKVTAELDSSEEKAKGLADALKEAASAMSSLLSFGQGLDKAIAVATAKVKALEAGTSGAVAGRIAGYRADLAAKLGDPALGMEDKESVSASYNRKIDELQTLLTREQGLRDKNKSGSDNVVNIKEIIAARELQMQQERTLIGLSEEQAERQRVYYDLLKQNKDADVQLTETEIRGAADAIAAFEEQNRVLQEAADKQRQIADTIQSSMEDAFMSIVDGTKSAEDAFKDMARIIIKELYKVLVVQQLVGSFKAGGGGIFGSIFGATQAEGGAWQGGSQIKAYANGGIVGAPTVFPMARGKIGLMGEAGPEAIMPLKRGANGKLGVQAEGGGGDNVVVHQNFNFQANGDDSVKRIIAQAAPQIANMTKKSMLDDRRRGGQMKATFG